MDPVRHCWAASQRLSCLIRSPRVSLPLAALDGLDVGLSIDGADHAGGLARLRRRWPAGVLDRGGGSTLRCRKGKTFRTPPFEGTPERDLGRARSAGFAGEPTILPMGAAKVVVVSHHRLPEPQFFRRATIGSASAVRKCRRRLKTWAARVRGSTRRHLRAGLRSEAARPARACSARSSHQDQFGSLPRRPAGAVGILRRPISRALNFVYNDFPIDVWFRTGGHAARIHGSPARARPLDGRTELAGAERRPVRRYRRRVPRPDGAPCQTRSRCQTLFRAGGGGPTTMPEPFRWSTCAL